MKISITGNLNFKLRGFIEGGKEKGKEKGREGGATVMS